MEKNINNKLKIGFSIGDFNGIGPEILLKAFYNKNLFEVCVPIVFSSRYILDYYKDKFSIDIDINDQNNNIKENQINCFSNEKFDSNILPGRVNMDAGRYAESSLRESIKYFKEGFIDSLITLPISKINIQSNTFQFPGHTEFLESEFTNEKSMMVMYSKDMIIGFVTGHVPLTEVHNYINEIKITEKFNIFLNSLIIDFNIENPQIAVLGLNPHSGEDSLLGVEESEIILPTMEKFNNKNKNFHGPFSSDSFFGLKMYKKFDGVISFYHDQGLTGFKAISFDHGVNYTAGLSIIRSSPDHGTAFNIAEKGIANEESLINSILLNIDVFNNRKLHK